MKELTLLNQVFGYDAFRPGQKELIDALLNGQDVMGTMPIGTGKSLCYQLPALMLPGLTLVVTPPSPQIREEITALRRVGVAVAFLENSLSPEQYAETLRRMKAGIFKILYVEPERLSDEEFLALSQSVEISLVAVEEAHCVSEWGYDYRPSYQNIAAFCKSLPKRPPVGAFTALATREVKHDIVYLLGLHRPLRLTRGYDRPNLYFDVEQPTNKDTWVANYVASHSEQSGVVYCSTQKLVEKVCAKLQNWAMP